MKIDETCINHNALKLIGAQILGVYETPSDQQDLECRISLGYIQGVHDLAEALKGVLKV